MEFLDWFLRLNDIAVAKGFADAGDPEKWHEEFNSGLTPEQAWNGSWDFT
jgi:hypothetical protein